MKIAGRARRGLYVSDGTVNVALLKQMPDEKAGLFHFCMWVDDLDEACQRLEAVQAKQLTQKDGLDVAMAPGRHRNFEMKWAGPDEVVFDISHTGWQTLPEEE